MNSAIQALISEFSEANGLDILVVEQFATSLVAASQKQTKPPKSKPKSEPRATTKPKPKPKAKSKPKAKKQSSSSKLNRAELQTAIYDYFKVSTGTELRKSSHFKSMVKPLGSVNLSKTADLEKIYREFLGLLPNETSETGYGCINGVDIFKYADVWTIFGIDSATATKDSVQSAYRSLSKQYHPDMPTGDRKIFERLTQLYQAALLGV